MNIHEVVAIGKTGMDLEPAPPKFQYVPDRPELRPYVFTTADYCPVPHLDPQSCLYNNPNRPATSEQIAAGEYRGADSRCYETDGTRSYSLCLRTRCNAPLGRVQVSAGGSWRTCEYDGQTHAVNGLRVKCPKAALVCPDLFCPANCAGRGECAHNRPDREDDGAFSGGYARRRARCLCDDEGDETPGCFGTNRTYPQVYGYAYESAEGANKMLFMVIVGSLVVGLAAIFVAARQWKARQGVFM